MNPRPAIARTLLVSALAGALGACATAPAHMALPEALVGAQRLPFEGLGFGRSGSFAIDGQTVRFERGADRVSFFDTLHLDRATLSFAIEAAARPPVQARCRARRVGVTVGVVAGEPSPLTMTCTFERAGVRSGELELTERSAAAGTRSERAGRFTGAAPAAGPSLELRSVHDLQGGAWPMPDAVGYLMLYEGRPVAAVELTDRRPTLIRAVREGAVADAITLAAVALALSWDPAATAP